MKQEEAVATAPDSWSRLPAASALRFHFVRTPEEVDAAASSPSAGVAPFFCHSVFGDTEEIAGFSKLRVDIFVSRDIALDVHIRASGSPCSALACDGFEEDEERCFSSMEEVPEKAPLCWTRLWTQLLQVPFPGGLCEGREQFLKKLQRRDLDSACEGDGSSSDVKGLFAEGEFVGEIWSDSLSSMLQLWRFRLRAKASSSEEARNQASPFARLHRRLEWLMQFFIDGASEIEADSRWRVYMPVRVDSQQRKPKVPLPSGCLLRQRSAALHTKFHAGEQGASDESSLQTGLSSRLRESEECTDSADAKYFLQSFKKRRKASSEEKEEAEEEADSEKENNEASAQIRSEGLSLHVSPASKQEEVSSDSRNKEAKPELPREHLPLKSCNTSRLEVLGCFTTYDFFSLNGLRRRISQALVLPHVQGKGVGLRVLECLFAEAASDESVFSLAAESPAPAFEQLRNAADLALCFDAQLLPVSWLWPSEAQTKKSEFQFLRSDFAARAGSPETRNLLSAFTKEPANQVSKLIEIILLAQVLPVEASNWGCAPNSELSQFWGRGWRSDFASSDSPKSRMASPAALDFASSQRCVSVRLAVKKRLWREATAGVKRRASSPSEKDACKEKKTGAFSISEEEKQRLEQEWLLHFFCYTRVRRVVEKTLASPYGYFMDFR